MYSCFKLHYFLSRFYQILYQVVLFSIINYHYFIILYLCIYIIIINNLVGSWSVNIKYLVLSTFIILYIIPNVHNLTAQEVHFRISSKTLTAVVYLDVWKALMSLIEFGIENYHAK